MSRSPDLFPHSRGAGDRIESSADETTPIIKKKGSTVGESAAAGSSADPQPQQAAPSNAPTSSRRKGKRAAGDQGNGGNEGKEKPGWLKAMVERYGALELDNKGSVARDHLALERTFLAWLRTSLAFASIGIAITQLFRLNTTLSERDDMPSRPDYEDGTIRLKQLGKPLGATFLGIAILVLFIGWRRYFESQYWLSKGKFPASRGSIFLVTIVAGALIVTSLVVVISVRRWDPEG